MIVSKDRRNIVATPTKTGTYSIEAGLKNKGWLIGRPRHRSSIPSWVVTNEPIKLHLTMRNPFARILSMYTYGFTSNHSRLKLWGRNGWPDFVKNWCEARVEDPEKFHDWVSTYFDYFARLQAIDDREIASISIHRIEDGIPEIMNRFGYPNHKDIFVNQSFNKFERPKDPWADPLVELVLPHITDDLQMGSYDPDPYMYLLKERAT
jgi:hypothetical protein